jgi:hypothetical protein
MVGRGPKRACMAPAKAGWDVTAVLQTTSATVSAVEVVVVAAGAKSGFEAGVRKMDGVRDWRVGRREGSWEKELGEVNCLV